ncbi:NF7O factor, partial [Nyctibius bracteatus]|nr:NF7O factor [Nyctibius bracteatus]
DTWWALGVARESVERKGYMELNPEMGIWALWHRKGRFTSLTNPRTPLAPSLLPRRILVCLDCAMGQVTFINADNGAEIF